MNDLYLQLSKFSKTSRNQHFTQNQKGNDYVVGDIHGEYDMFFEELKRQDIDTDNDRVFAVGDLCDRGPKSKECIELIKEPWFFSVLGNHEQMFLDSMDNKGSFDHWYQNGGGWTWDMSPQEKDDLFQLVMQMPTSITVDVGKKLIGIVHADCPDDWDNVEDRIHREKLIWSRTRVKYRIKEPVENIDMVYFGHTPSSGIRIQGNTMCIDTAACMGGYMTVIKL